MGQLIILLQKEWKYKKKEKKTISAFNHHAVCPTPESLTATQPTTTILYLFIDLIGQPIFLYILSFKAHVSFYFYFFFQSVCYGIIRKEEGDELPAICEVMSVVKTLKENI